MVQASASSGPALQEHRAPVCPFSAKRQIATAATTTTTTTTTTPAAAATTTTTTTTTTATTALGTADLCGQASVGDCQNNYARDPSKETRTTHIEPRSMEH